MQDVEKAAFRRVMVKLLRGIDFFRKLVLNIVFFIVLYYVLLFLFRDTVPIVPGSTALIIDPKGRIVEELTPASFSTPLMRAVNMSSRETLLKDLVNAIAAAKNDPRVRILVLSLDDMEETGIPKLFEIGQAIEHFKKSGKKVFAVSDNYNRSSYYLAAHADSIFMNPMGMVILEGFSKYLTYYRDALDRLGVEVNIFRVGKYKSAVEPFLRSDMSPEDKESTIQWLNGLWRSYLDDIVKARKGLVTYESLVDYTEGFNERLKEAKGDTAVMAVSAGLVDEARTRDQIRKTLIRKAGENMETRSYNQVNYLDYLKALNLDGWGDTASDNVIGVITAKGDILDGRQLPGTIGGESTADLIRKAYMDKRVKAIVLRVDSPGGSSFASEMIRQELDTARQRHLPVIVSMGSVAASGGYWISMASDEVWAYPTTITGSIGIFGMFPTFHKTLDKFLGVRVDGVGTNKLAGAFRLDRPLSPGVGEAIQLVIENGYTQFVNIVAKCRKMSPEKVNEIAQGRVWIGSDAYKLGLVDKMGSFNDAVVSAAKRARLGKDYSVKFFRPQLTYGQQWMNNFFAKAKNLSSISPDAANSFQSFSGLEVSTAVERVLFSLFEQIQRLRCFNDPRGVYAYCFLSADLY